MADLIVQIPFFDKKEGVSRNAGDVFTAAEDRAAELRSLGIVRLAPAKKQPVKRKTRVAKKAAK